jgi:hypothetical protein
MIRVLEDVPANVVAVEASGTVTEDDYESVLVPAVEARTKANEKVRFLYVLGEDFDGWTFGALWEDARLGTREFRAWDKVAVVTDKDWLKHMVNAFGWMIPGEVRVFGLAALDDAKAWVAT